MTDLTNVAERIYHSVASGYSFGCLTQELADQARCPDHDTPSSSPHPAEPASRRACQLLPAASSAHGGIEGPSYGPGEDLFRRCQNGDPAVRAISALPTRSGASPTSPIGYSHVALVIARVDGKLLADACVRRRIETLHTEVMNMRQWIGARLWESVGRQKSESCSGGSFVDVVQAA